MSQSNIRYLLLLLLATTGVAFAQGNPALREDAPDRYIVERGDTLWGIAQRFLKDPWRWQDVWKMNQDQVRNPNRIYPGNVIVLDRRSGSLRMAEESVLRLSPQIRGEAVAAAPIPTIPPSIIEPFLSQPLVIEQGGLENAPRVISAQESRINVSTGSTIYVSGIGQGAATNWYIYRPGRALIDPDTKQSLGVEAIYLGTARVEVPGEPATLQITGARQEIGPGDRLVAAGEPVMNQYTPRLPDKKLAARVIGIYGRLFDTARYAAAGQPAYEGEAGRYTVLSINKGKKDGIEPGHVLALFRAGVSIPDPEAGVSRDRARQIRLPDERYGVVFVFRTFDSVSYALVMESSRPVQTADSLRTP